MRTTYNLITISLCGLVLTTVGCTSTFSSSATSVVASANQAASTGTGTSTGTGAGSGTGTSTSGTSGLKATQLGLIVNDNDPNSIEVASYYQAARHIPAANIVHVSLPVQASITRAQFAPIKAQVDAALPSNVQAMAIAWTNPSRVECNSMTSALTRGFAAAPCDSNTCNLDVMSPYYESNSTQPYTDLKMRPSMMLAGYSVAEVKAMIDRGVASDGTQPKGSAYTMHTTDTVRSTRAIYLQNTLYHALGYAISPNVNLQVITANSIVGTKDALFYFQGLASVPDITTNTFPPGAVADHLTSFGGMLTDSGQMSCLKFIEGGATGSFGTVSEPCAYLEKFPAPTVMITYYTKGETLIESYWKSVNQTFQGEFVGEPLANPWMH